MTNKQQKLSDYSKDTEPETAKNNGNNTNDSRNGKSEIEELCPYYKEALSTYGSEIRGYNVTYVKCGHALGYLAETPGSNIGNSTFENYRSSLAAYIDWLHEQDKIAIEAEFSDVDKFFKFDGKRGTAKGTLEGRKSAIVHLYKYIRFHTDLEPNVKYDRIREEIDPVNYTQKSQMNRQGMNKEQVEKLLNAVETFQTKLMTLIGVNFGPRNIDIVSILTDDVNLNEGTIELKNTKRNRRFTRPIPAKLKLLLRGWKQIERPSHLGDNDSEYLFPNANGTMMDPAYFTEKIREAAERAGIQYTIGKAPMNERQKRALGTDKDYRVINGITPHTFRHTFNTLLQEEGVELELRSKMLDHESTEVTEKFYDSYNKKIDEIIGEMHLSGRFDF